MVIEKNIYPYIALRDEPLSSALKKINHNKSGFVIVVNRNGTIKGILTDGDFRRWTLIAENKNLDQPVINVCNRSFVSEHESCSFEELNLRLSDEISFIPLVDSKQRFVGLAQNVKHAFNLSSFVISDTNPTFIIAEIGNNHNGNFKLAKKLVDKAVEAGANCAKFQMRNMKTMYRRSNNSEDLGAEYTLDLLAKFQLSNDELLKIFDYCKQKNILPLCTPFDEKSLIYLENYGIEGYKVASADLTNHDLIKKICETRKPIICSTGMSKESEIVSAVKLMQSYSSSYALLHCNSTYPTPFKDVNLNYISNLKKLGVDCEVGYSGHERGYAIPIAAVAKGARIVEKHLTLDKKMEGNDHRVSLLPDEFSQMVKSIREVEQALGSNDTRVVTQGEMMNREFLAKSIIASRDIKSGEKIKQSDLDIKSPGKGLVPYRKKELIGKISKRDIKKGEFFFENDIYEISYKSKKYKFRRPFGIPVRYHDFKENIQKSNFDMVEFHLSYRDMELDISSFFEANIYEMDFVIHSPELFEGDHIMDLSSSNKEYRSRSISELQRVIDITRNIKTYFKNTSCPKIIINAGGSSQDYQIPFSDRQKKYTSIANALKQVDSNGVEIIPQTMPPFPWHFGGQRFHNLFMEADEIVSFCNENKMRICLDISHSKLVCNRNNESFKQFLEKVSPYTAHIHMVDAAGVDQEGLQIHDGEIDFAMVASILDKFCPTSSFIPEIWQGHKNECRGFWIALERLEKYF
ncbi:MAG: N-acetylneuraminate synthase family protein [Flavobacteriaceae bacterium]